MRLWNGLLAIGLIGLASPGVAGEPVVFETQVQPIFKAKCVRCHGETKRNAGLSLATSAALLKGGESGEVIVAGKPEESLLYEMIEDLQMPPQGNPELTRTEVELIGRWIKEGAKLAVPTKEPAITHQQIVPLMLLRCAPCHGGRRREADLDVRTKESLLRGGKSGPAVVPGQPEESLLIKRIKAEEMPPRRLLVSVSVKPMEAGELKKLEAWIAAGLPEAPAVPENEPDRLVSDEDRQFWSFRPPVRTAPPPVRGVAGAGPTGSPGERLSARDAGPRSPGFRFAPTPATRTPIDAFLLAKLREKGLGFSPEADRATLIRRVSFDLIGLPPTPEEVDAFIDDPSPRAYETLVDRLLASPHYGERWARHWLDIAGYADSEGAQNEDRVRPNMWRYRDYVIRAFNADKPYDRFLHEQLAGDELAEYETAAEITPEIYDNLVATGFLRTAPDRTFANITNFVPDRLEVIADEIQILGTAVMGLTLHCSRCHSHKFDPLPQRDYYRLMATLKDGWDEHDWLGPEVRQLSFVTTAERQTWEQTRDRIAAQVAPLKEQLAKETDEAKKKPLQQQIQQLEAGLPPEPKIRALWSRGDPSPTYLLQRGNSLTPGDEVTPGVPAVLTDGRTPFKVEPPWPGAKSTGRRLAFARWLTSDTHPLTARVMANRIWRHHFGTGLVASLGNFGKTGAAPSHPELLDWLAREFIENGWSMKHMHRLMVTSTAYRQTSQRTPESAAVDPENRLLGHMPLRRLEAEAIRDAMLFVAGQLDTTAYGPPDDVDVRGDGLVTPKGTRRSIYVLHRRTKMPTLLESFDSPQMGPNCLERGESIVAPQALHLLNNAAVREIAVAFAARTEREAGDDPSAQIKQAHEWAFGRPPDEEEMRTATEIHAQLVEQWKQKGSSEADSRQRAIQNACHALLNSAPFVYVD